MSFSESSSKESVNISCSEAINIIDDNERGFGESSDLLSHSTFLCQYENQINNLIDYYNYRKITGIQQINSNFFMTNFVILFFIKNNLNEMDKFINDYVVKYKIDKDRIFNLWKSLKQFLINNFNTEDIQNIGINNENNAKQLEGDFDKLLICLINDDVANQNGIEYFDLKRISENQIKPLGPIREFARAFIIFILDMPAHVILLDEKHPFVELKIYLVEIQAGPFDNDVMCNFSHKNSKQLFPSSNCNEDASNECRIESDLPNPNDAAIPSTSSQETTNDVKKSLDVPKFASNETSEDENALLKSQNVELEKSEEFRISETLSTNHKFNKYYSRIRSQFDLDHEVTFKFLDEIKIKKSSIWLMILKVLFSFSSILDMILDIFLAYTFLQSDQMLFGILTIAILIITGTINVFLEKRFVKKLKQESNYLPSSLNYASLRYICSFFQLSVFLCSFKYAIVSIKAAKEEEIETLLKLLYGHDKNNLHYESQILKHVETYLEALPQIILQIYIILTTKQWVWIQLVSIVSGMANIQFTILGFEAFLNNINLINIWKHPIMILATFFHIGSLITSHSFLFWQFHWIFGFLWILLHVLISSFSKLNKEDGTLIFLNWNIKKIKYGRIFNKITVIDHFIILCLFMIKLDQFKDPIFVALFVCQITFYIIWIIAIFRRKFIFFSNVMYTPHVVIEP